MRLAADARKLWATHGDQFEGVIRCAPRLVHVGDRDHATTLKVNRHLNSLRARVGPYWSLSRYLELKVKRTVACVRDFEAAIAREVRARGAGGVVCGYIHHAESRGIDGVPYANEGDCVESQTALVEHTEGRLEVVDWSARKAAVGSDRPVPMPAPAIEPEMLAWSAFARRRPSRQRRVRK